MSPLWEGRRVVVSVGTGGVGKTTVSATMAVAAAASGLRTLVMTIDPARRLANALGLDHLGNVERQIPAEQLRPYGVELKAPLWVMMPDVKRTFDDLIARWAPSEQVRQRIMDNRIYQHFSTVLAGSHEYAAVEKLYEVYTSGHYDLIVLDTPPSQNAVDFLDAPGRIVDFLEQETLQWLFKPYMLAGRFSLKLLDFGSSFILKTLGKMAGADTLRELADFILGFQGMYDGFRDRSRRVKALLASEELAFVLVTSTLPKQHEAMLRFRAELRREGLRSRALVVNRVRRPPFPEGQEAAVQSALRAALPSDPDGEAALWQALQEEAALAHADRQAIAKVREAVAPVPIIELPELPLDAHDLESLAVLHRAFLG